MFDLKTLAVLRQIKVGPGLDGIIYDEPDDKIIAEYPHLSKSPFRMAARGRSRPAKGRRESRMTRRRTTFSPDATRRPSSLTRAWAES
jgi:hypothetical protein